MKIGEEYSMNGLSVQLGYKGISKTFSACVEEMIKDGYIERNISSIFNNLLYKLLISWNPILYPKF